MANWTPEQWNTFFIFAGGFVVMVGTQITNLLISLRNGRKVDSNTQMTSDIHKVTNGPLVEIGQSVKDIVTQAATNAAIASSAVEAAKVQATIDAKASKESR